MSRLCKGAYRRAELELTELEALQTRTAMWGFMICVATALLSIAIVVIGGPRWVPWAGWIYMLLGPAQAVFHTWAGRRGRRLAAHLAA